uniref:MHC class II beta chain N-terminal domain-containing protein n=1 Tax=Taeniopygia guttata TaxID=59729 RepID=A0A674HBD2_TAEGU
MGRGAAAGAVLVALVALGAAPAAGAELSAVLQFMGKSECHFTNGTEKVRFVERHIYNRLQYAMFDSDVGEYVGFTPFGEKQARYWNSNPEIMEYKRGQVDNYCRHNYRVFAPFSVERRGERGAELSLVPSSSQPGPGRLPLLRAGFLPCPDPGEVVPGPAGALGARGGHRGGPQRGTGATSCWCCWKPPPGAAHLQLPGGARQPGAPPEPELGDAAGRRPQQDADGHRGLRLGLALPGAGARLLPAQEGPGGCRGSCPPRAGAAELPPGPPARPHPLFSARRAPELPAAAAAPRGLGPGRDPPLRPRGDFGGVPCPPQPRCRSAPARPLPVLPIKLPSWPRGRLWGAGWGEGFGGAVGTGLGKGRGTEGWRRRRRRRSREELPGRFLGSPALFWGFCAHAAPAALQPRGRRSPPALPSLSRPNRSRSRLSPRRKPGPPPPSKRRCSTAPAIPIDSRGRLRSPAPGALRLSAALSGICHSRGAGKPRNGEHPPVCIGNIPLSALGTSPCVHWEHPPVCIGNIPLCALGTSPCVHWEHPPVCPGNIPLCAPGTSPCVHWEHPPVCIGNIPLCALGTSPCVHWEHPCCLQGRQW